MHSPGSVRLARSRRTARRSDVLFSSLDWHGYGPRRVHGRGIVRMYTSPLRLRLSAVSSYTPCALPKASIGRFMYVRARYAAPATPRFETPPPLCSKQTVPCGSSEQLQVPGHSIARQTLGIDDGGRTEAATVACCAIPAAMMGCWTLRWHREFWCLPRHTGGCLSGTQLFRVGCPVRSLLRETRLQVNEIPVWYRNWPWSCRSRDCNRHSPL
jgi:hypothetical protein